MILLGATRASASTGGFDQVCRIRVSVLLRASQGGLPPGELREIYEPTRDGVSDLRSTDWSVEELVKTVAGRIYDNQFIPLDLQQRLIDLTMA